MASLLPNPKLQFVDANGVPRVGAKLFSYIATSSTKKDTYQDSTQLSLNTNPIILDASGSCTVFGEGAYKFILAPSTDTDPPASPYWTVDNVNIYDMVDLYGLTATVKDLNSTIASTVAVSSATYTVSATADKGKTILVNAASAPVTIYLPTNVSATTGFSICIKKTDASSNAVTITPSGVETIDGLTTITLNSTNEEYQLLSNASTWNIISRFRRGLSRAVTTATTLTYANEDDLILADATTAAITITLPLLGSTGIGREWKVSIRKSDSTSHLITIIGQSGQLINGGANIVLNNQYETTNLRGTDSAWTVVSKSDSQGIHSPLPFGYINGLRITKMSTVLLAVGLGGCDSYDLAVDIKNYGNAAFSKAINSTWVEGSGLGGFPTGITLTDNTWYYVFAMSDSSGTKFDVGYDSSVYATNLMATASVVASLYVKYRLIWAVKYFTSGGIKGFEMARCSSAGGNSLVSRRICIWTGGAPYDYTNAGVMTTPATINLPSVPPFVGADYATESVIAVSATGATAGTGGVHYSAFDAWVYPTTIAIDTNSVPTLSAEMFSSISSAATARGACVMPIMTANGNINVAKTQSTDGTTTQTFNISVISWEMII